MDGSSLLKCHIRPLATVLELRRIIYQGNSAVEKAILLQADILLLSKNDTSGCGLGSEKQRKAVAQGRKGAYQTAD
jgi:hypothetical protein